ncbi:phospholipase D-like domain-containing protein [Vulgatibacter sp.]|uniref:phospholipase D-like domain-containing protein n=1 Tax=Vulgatibacter sp. TaxID=1971226 RepID=UPI003564B8D3
MPRRFPLLLLALLALQLACDPAHSIQGGGQAGTGGGGGAGGNGGATTAPELPTVALEELVIQPGGGRAFLLDALARAQTSVRVVAYILTDDQIEDALVATAGRGIPVRAIVPGDMSVNADARTKLQNGGVSVRNGHPGYALTHEKAVVVDDELAFVLNQNLSWSGFERNREYDAVITGQPARDVASIFDADWQHLPYTADTDLVVSPLNSRARLEALLRAADQTIDIAMEVMNDREMIELVKARAADGIAVRVLLEDPADVDDNAATASQLASAGVDVRWLPNPDLHAKAVVIDGSFAYIGSVNFTYHSLSRNREVGLVTADEEAVARIASTFAADFANGRTDF